MKTSKILMAIAIAAAFSANTAFAADNMDNMDNMEKCKVVKDGKGMIKANKADCASLSHSCAGQNKAGDAGSWIKVPKGQCDKINAGDFSSVSEEVKNKVEGAE
jgi:hypothetical protein